MQWYTVTCFPDVVIYSKTLTAQYRERTSCMLLFWFFFSVQNRYRCERVVYYPYLICTHVSPGRFEYAHHVLIMLQFIWTHDHINYSFLLARDLLSDYKSIFSLPLYRRCHISIRKRLHLDFFFFEKKSVPCTYENIIIFRCRRILVVMENVGKSPYELDLIKNVLGAEEWREEKKRLGRKSDPAYIIFNVLFSRCACFYFINFIRRPLRIRTTAISLKQISYKEGKSWKFYYLLHTMYTTSICNYVNRITKWKLQLIFFVYKSASRLRICLFFTFVSLN